MLGLLLIYFIGKYFYDLADNHDKNKWLFAILGVISYYFGTFIAGILIAIGYELWGVTSIENVNSLKLSFMALPIGILCCVSLYFILKRSWAKQETIDDTLIDEIGNHE